MALGKIAVGKSAIGSLKATIDSSIISNNKSASLILPRRFTSQPQGAVEIDWGNESLKAVISGNEIYTPSGHKQASGSYSTNAGKVLLSGGNQYLKADIGFISAAANAITIELLFNPSSIPSLASAITLSPDSTTTGICTGAQGSVRGLLGYTGGSPLDMYAWGGDQDYDTNTPFTLSRQHLIIVKSAGAGAVPWKVYLDGVLVSSGNSSNAQPWVNSGPYLYLGTRHVAGATNITAEYEFAAVHSRELSAAEISDRAANPWQIFRAKPRVLYFDASTGSSFPSLSSITASNFTTSGARLTVN